MKPIVDVSHHNDVINWEKAKPHISGAIIRCGYGQDMIKQDDRRFTRNWQECERLGIPYGLYLYSYADTNEKVKSEVEHFKRLINRCGKMRKLPLFYDLEEPGTEDYSANAANRYISLMTAAGFKKSELGIYASQSWWQEHLYPGDFWDIKLCYWVARYSTRQPVVACDLWQYTESGNIPGIGTCDLSKPTTNFFNSFLFEAPVPDPDLLADGILAGRFGNGNARAQALGNNYDIAQLIANLRLGITYGLDKVARDVIAGRYGNGLARKKALGSAYEKVQQRVNELLKIKSLPKS